MKKHLAIILAAIIIAGFSAFTAHHLNKNHPRVEDVYFHYIPEDGSEGAYETVESWEVATTDPECTNLDSDPCIIIVPSEYLDDITDDEAKVQSLVDYLYDQGNMGTTYANAAAAVAAFTDVTKP